MLKKVIFIITALLIFSITNGCEDRNKPITQQETQRIAETVVEDTEDAQINNYNSPEIEKIQEKNTHKVAFSNNGEKATLTDIKGKTAWKITYYTDLDGLLGPIIVYIDYFTGKIYGFDLRY